MLKKLSASLALGTLAITLATPAFAASNEKATTQSFLTEEETAIITELKKEMKANSKTIVGLIQLGNEPLIEKSDKIQKTKNKLERTRLEHPNAYAEFLTTMDVKNPNIYQPKLDQLKLKADEKQIVQFDDGSLVVASVTPSVEPKSIVAEGSYSGYNSSYNYHFELWGIYKAADLNLTTYYNIGYQYSSVTARDVTTTYSTIYPTTMNSATGVIVKSSGGYNDYIETRGTFYLRDSLTGGAWGSRDYTFTLHTKVYNDDTTYNWNN